MFKEALLSLKSILFPDSCPVCGKAMSTGDSVVCIECHLSAPLTNLWTERDNLMEQRFWGSVPIERAAAFIWFTDGSPWQAMIHNFKYRNHWYYAENMGRWFAAELSKGGFLEGIDTIVPVPLHWQRRLLRGYNQCEHFAAGISAYSAIPSTFNAVKRTINNPPQAKMMHSERWDNISNIFAVTHPEKLKGKHILLVDDVFTTGATLTTLAKAIYDTCQGDVKLSVATFAASSHLLNI